MLCHVFSFEAPVFFELLCTEFCLQNACPPSTKSWRYAPEGDVHAQDQLDGWEITIDRLTLNEVPVTI